MRKKIKEKSTHHILTFLIFSLTVTGSFFWFMSPPIVTRGETQVPEIVSLVPYTYPSKHVIVTLNNMTIALMDGTSTLGVYPLLSIGKPGSYYETIGGVHENDYKKPLHFSSIGHVYMPHSVHVFGNYFIHGVPYYPNGTQVSSTYSGGCIRLSNKDAKVVYDFIDKGTPIILTRDSPSSFNPTTVSSRTLTSARMTNLMAATISLETLTQDNPIIGVEGEVTTRRKILPRLLLDSNPAVTNIYAQNIGEENFVNLMNQKAKALGLSNTYFSDVRSPVVTSYEDYNQFMEYIAEYKSYLLRVKDGK